MMLAKHFAFSSDELAGQVRRLVATRLLMYLGAMSSYFIGVLGTLAYAMGAGVADNAVAVGLLNLFIVIGGLRGGALLDRIGPHRHVRVCAVLLVASGVIYQVIGTTVAGVFIGAALFGFAWGVSDVVARAYPAYLTDRIDDLKRINSAMTLTGNVAIVMGPLVGGLITKVASTQAVFMFMVICSALSLLPAWGIRALRDPGAGACPVEGGGVAAGFSVIFGSGVLSLLFWATMLSFMGYGAFDPLESLFYRDVLQVGPEWMGWLSALSGVGGVAGALLAGVLPARFVNVRSLLIVLVATGLGSLLYVGTPFVLVACAGQLVLGVAFSAFGPIKDTLVQVHAPLDCVGRVNAALNAGYNMAGALPLLCAPVLAGIFGVQGTLIAAGVLVAGVPALFLAVRWRVVDGLVASERKAAGCEETTTHLPAESSDF